MNTTIHQEVNGQIMKIEMMVEGVMNFYVSDVQDNEYIMDVNYKKLAMETTTMGQTMKFSSESVDNEHDLMSKLLASMTEKSFSCHMNKYGSISQISGMEELWEDMIDSIPGLAEMEKKQLQQKMKSTYGDEAFQNSFGLSTHIFPDYSVNVNEIWYIKASLGGMIPAEMECDYVFAEDTEDHYKIYGDSRIQTDREKGVEMNGMESQFDLRGDYNSEITIDKESRWIIASKNNYYLEGQIFIMPNAQMPEGMKVPFRMNTHGSVTSN